MALPIAAGILAGCGFYYISRVAPRIAQRVSASGAQSAPSRFLNSAKQYHKFECGFQSPMTEYEAYLLLGFKESEAGAIFHRPPPEEVKKRYRNMMKVFHSDASGTSYIATKLNEAKDLLIK
ncbi:conserved hypothetical protein [Leishmania braziliensis MHOM/BR/75/M2904]|uniref:J domain-containing protein n=2 Tax=Leishmania braziliensis TaxID=5660 RepID=A4HDQ3_LEIBR|nr:conserved hypothetical protein [Leishmania braziliensis MHOM/BR/75/M2904]KAI5688243.1 hypothetical protein MNV84_04286 [Leishmania braziliensis]CAJ2473837.1 unnamed protein product [Leishmania braziliensis]CAM42374.2 conserved hypothetical protein [Leishmania braziliensis MHOM/BR/75/M2904]SYZ66363.1 hypothetical_protein [Leishmania braziliensis MHOM/BR/75/M2904]